jgi:hypothetical protein
VLFLAAGGAAAPEHAVPGEPDVRAAAEAADGEVFGRVYERRPDGEPVGRTLSGPQEPAPSVVPIASVAARQVAATLRRAEAARASDLDDLVHARGAPRLVPEDLSRRAHVFHMGVEEYTDAALAQFVARVGRREGFAVVARVAPDSTWTAELAHTDNLTLAVLPGVQYVWSEDIAEIGVDGSVNMTARMGDIALLRRALFVDRVRRLYPEVSTAELSEIERVPTAPDELPGQLPHEVRRRFPDILFMNLGLVEKERGQVVAAAIADARGAPLREAVTYLEGGNVLLGTGRDGAPYALVGRDSAAVSRALLQRHHGRAVSEAEVISAMAKDLAVEPRRLFLVEQPGVFHIDMAMTLLGPGTVLFNDALDAHRLQVQWLREDHDRRRPRLDPAAPASDDLRALELWRDAGRDLDETIAKLAKYAERFARYEARTLADLHAAGLAVVRIPARFPHPTRPADRDVMNFVNGEAGTNPQGLTYFVTQGGDPRAEHRIAARLLATDIGLDRVYFAPRLASRDSLWEKGGVNCRVKAEGDVITPRLDNPPSPR